MSLLNPKVPLKYPQTHTQSCLPLSNQTSQGYRLSGKEIAVHSLARLPFLIQICTLMVGHGIFLHPFKLSGRERALHGCYVLLSCFLSHIVKRAPSPPPNHVAKALCLRFFHCNITNRESAEDELYASDPHKGQVVIVENTVYTYICNT